MKEAMERALDARQSIERAQEVISGFVHVDDEEGEDENEEDEERNESAV